MQQIKLEYIAYRSNEFNTGLLPDSLHVIEQMCMRVEKFKNRLYSTGDCFIGTYGSNKIFNFLKATLHEGRQAIRRPQMDEIAEQILKKHYKYEINKLKKQIAVEIRNILKQFYFKYPKGTFV